MQHPNGSVLAIYQKLERAGHARRMRKTVRCEEATDLQVEPRTFFELAIQLEDETIAVCD